MVPKSTLVAATESGIQATFESLNIFCKSFIVCRVLTNPFRQRTVSSLYLNETFSNFLSHSEFRRIVYCCCELPYRL